ncbi:MAG: hypothetical protein ACKOBN_08440 [Flavobacteriales bacterium]
MKLTEEQLATLVLAYHEGELTSAQRLELDAYLLANPDFQNELADLIFLTPDQQSYNGPSLEKNEFDQIKIYSSETGHPYEKLAIGLLENELSNHEMNLVDSLKHDQHFLGVQKQIAQTQLKPDLQISYPRTEQLLKEVPIRSINQKLYYFAASAAAAIVFALFLINQQSPSNPTGMLAHKTSFKKNLQKKIVQEQTPNLDFNLTQQASVNSNHLLSHTPNHAKKVLTHIHEGPRPIEINENRIDFEPGILAVIDPIENENSNLNAQQQNPVFSPPTQNQGIPTSKAFTKEPVSVKTFLLQKTNERLFGTAEPSTDMRYETMARYASQTIGLPVRYEVEEGAQQDKIVFQLGPISIERTKSKK